MIRQPDGAQTAWFLRACLDDPLGAALTTRFAAYPPGAGKAGYWVELDDDGPVGALSYLDGALTAVFPDGERADPDELGAFAEYLRAKTLLVSGYPLGRSLTALRCDRGFPDTAEPLEKTDLANLARLMTQGDAPDAMRADLALRFGAGLLRGRVIRSDGRPVSCAVTAGETAACALFSGVATDPAHRGQGFARACVTSLAGALGKPCYVLTDDARTAGWYGAMGFAPWEKPVCALSL